MALTRTGRPCGSCSTRRRLTPPGELLVWSQPRYPVSLIVAADATAFPGVMNQRARKLAELAELAYRIRHGIAAFDDRLAEMGDGPPGRGHARGGKGSHSSPVEREAVDGRRPPVVTSEFDRRLDRAHAAMVDLEAAYRPIAQPVVGLPTKGRANCEWCENAARAWRNAALRVGDEDAATTSPVATHRCPPYLHAVFRDDRGKETRALVCEWCYRFNLRHGRAPTTEELWLHAQGLRVLVKPGKKSRPKPTRAVERLASP